MAKTLLAKDSKKKNGSHVGPHKYMQIEWGKNKTLVYRCMLKDCPHYLHVEMMRNRTSLCWKCNEPFLVTHDKLRRIKPKCDKCQHKNDPILSRLDDLLKDL